MKVKDLFLKFWPVLLIIFVWFIFSHPYFIQGKVPFPSTYQVTTFAPWSAYETYLGPVKNSAMPDIITQIYPWRNLVIEIWKSGQVPLWNPYSFSGTPLLADYQSAVFAPINLLFFVLPFIDGWSVAVLLQPLLAGIFMYMFVYTLGPSRVGSLISAFSFMFCGFMTTWMDYATLGYAILFLPLALFAVEKYLSLNKIRYLLLLSITIPLSFFSGHFQISLYFLLFIFIYLTYKFIVNSNKIKIFHLIVFVFFGLLLSAIQLIPSIELYLQSLRSTIFQEAEVIPLGYLPTLLAPDFFGNPVTRNDWFGHYAEWNGYIGLTTLILAAYSLLGKKRHISLFLFLAGIFALMLSLNTQLSALMVSFKIPVLSTSAASRIIVLYSFAFSVIAAFGFDNLINNFKNKKIKSFYSLLVIFGCLLLSLWLIVLLKLFIPLDKLITARQNLILPTLIFFALFFTLIIGVILSKYRRLSIYLVSLFILALVGFDMLRFAVKWQVFDPKNLVFPKIQAVDEFSKISGYERVYGNFGAESSVYYKLPSVEGYDALYIRHYGELISTLKDGELKDSSRSVVAFPKNGLYTPKALNLLNIRYIVHKLSDGREIWAFPFWTYPENQFKLIYKDNKYEIYENTDSFPHALFIGEYAVITDSQEAINTMFGDNFDLKNKIVLDKKPKFESKKGINGQVEIKKYTSNIVEIDVDAEQTGLLLLTDTYYPGWMAKVDGINVPIYRADYSFRALEVPSGKHKVEFVYFPLSFRLGLYSAILGLFAIVGLGIILRVKKD